MKESGCKSLEPKRAFIIQKFPALRRGSNTKYAEPAPAAAFMSGKMLLNRFITTLNLWQFRLCAGWMFSCPNRLPELFPP